MPVILMVLCFASLGIGGLEMLGGSGVIGAIFSLAAAVFFTGSAVISAIQRLEPRAPESPEKAFERERLK